MTGASEKPVALVTGSGPPRVGQAVVRALAEHGYRVALHAHTSIDQAEQTAQELSAKGTEAIAVAADVRDERQVAGMVDRVHRHFQRIDGLVNCAALWKSKALEEVTAADVREHFEVNALGTFLCCQAVGRIMVAQPDGGAIVNFGDWATVRPYREYSAYFPSKGAIEAMTRALAIELARRNRRIRVNAILPGPVMLPADMSKEDREAAIRGTLLRREGTPADVADAVLFLLRNPFVTGVCLPVDGGRTICQSDG